MALGRAWLGAGALKRRSPTHSPGALVGLVSTAQTPLSPARARRSPPFKHPCHADETPPAIDAGTTPAGATPPSLGATSAVVTLPAITVSDGSGGVTVNCTGAFAGSALTYNLGNPGANTVNLTAGVSDAVTPVTCIAYDASGNHAAVTFDVTVCGSARYWSGTGCQVSA
jgi:hypothetical protein